MSWGSIPYWPRRRAVRSAAAPWSQTAQAAASGAGRPQAARPAVMPASTSPLPPRARPALPVVFSHRRPSGAATMVRCPFSTRVQPHAPA